MTSRDHIQDLNAIFDALSESVVEESDDRLIAEVRESGQDPNALLAQVKDVLRQAVKQTQSVGFDSARQRAL